MVVIGVVVKFEIKEDIGKTTEILVKTCNILDGEDIFSIVPMRICYFA